MKQIALTQGKFALIDDADFEWLNQWKWTFDGHYAQRNKYYDGKKKKVYMHRLIMDAPSDKQVDHKNGDRLNNCRNNLRLCTPNQNRANIAAKGYSWHKMGHKWMVSFSFEGKRYYFGLFIDENEAAQVYKSAVRKIKGEYAR